MPNVQLELTTLKSKSCWLYWLSWVQIQHPVKPTFQNFLLVAAVVSWPGDCCQCRPDTDTSHGDMFHNNIHQIPLPATPSSSPKHLLGVLGPSDLCCRWLNLQDTSHTYLKLTKFCGGNFWHVLHKSWSFLSWSCTLRKKKKKSNPYS